MVFVRRKATIALVPTMGALHDGHVSLVRLAKRRAAKVVVSIFVNPTQFAPSEDFGSYPRTWKADVAKLAAENVDLIWNPDVKTMYPDGFATRILTEGPATAGLEDRFRPHFFGGVATVVGKLFTQVPAGFRDLRRKGFPAIAGGDADGRRSRPRRQGDRLAHRARARWPRDVVAQRLFVAGPAPGRADAVPRDEGKRRALAGRRRRREPRWPRGAELIVGAGFALDYFEVRHAETLAPIASVKDGPMRILVAAKIGKTRLIDNIAV